MTTSNRLRRYTEAVQFLYGLQFFGIKLGLANMRRLLAEVGDPQRQFRSIHVAGTNGKGSTSAMLASVLAEAGYRTALYTSPHIVDVRERARVNGKPIPREAFLRWTDELRSPVLERKMTFFEAMTAVALAWFAEERVDVAVIETGLGGRLDATNIVRPVLSVITSVGLEHTALLGPTTTAIAGEKAGIIKRRVPVVSGVTRSDARGVIKGTALRRQAEYFESGEVTVSVRSSNISGTVVNVSSGAVNLSSLHLSLPGLFQVDNLRTVLAALNVMSSEIGFPIPDDAVRRGLASVGRNTGFMGRMSVIRQSPLVIADVAHNPEAMRSLSRALRAIGTGRMHVVIGVSGDKDVTQIARALKPIAVVATAVAAKTHRARRAEDVAAAFRKEGVSCSIGGPVGPAIRKVIGQRFQKLPILITGSHFVVGEALAALENRRYLTISQ